MFEDMKMPLKERLCIIGVKASDLSKEDVKILNEALDNTLWAAGSLSEELTRRGFEVGRGSVEKHRKKICLCFKV
jgi:hypothetical protein